MPLYNEETPKVDTQPGSLYNSNAAQGKAGIERLHQPYKKRSQQLNSPTNESNQAMALDKGGQDVIIDELDSVHPKQTTKGRRGQLTARGRKISSNDLAVGAIMRN